MKKQIFVIPFLFLFFVTGCKKKSNEQNIKEKEIFPAAAQVLTQKTQKKLPVEKERLTKRVKTMQKQEAQPEKLKEEIIYPPKIKYISHSIEDSNKNNQIDEGEKIKLKITIQNTGKGEGKELGVKIDSEGKLVADMDEFSIWPVAPGETKEFTIGFLVPAGSSSEIPLHIIFSEGTKIDIKLNVVQKTKTEEEIKKEQFKNRLEEKRKKAFEELELK